jgi:hypothetical protein
VAYSQASWPSPGNIVTSHGEVAANPLEETLSPTVPPKANLLQWPPQLTKFPQKAWAWIAEDLAKLKSNVLITPWQLLSLSITT